MQKLLVLLLSSILLVSCGEGVDEKNPAQKQIDSYSKEVEECRDSVAEKKSEKAKQEAIKQLDKKEVFVRDFSIATDDMVVGNRESKVLVIEYFAPTCPHCYGFLKRTYPELKKKYIDTGKIAYVFREFVGNRQDLDASILARCKGDVDTYIKFVEVLLSKQDSWAYTRKFKELLTNIGMLGGVSPEEYARCLDDESLAEILIENTKLPVKVPGFVGTPTFFINGEHFTKPYTLEELSKAIEEALAKNS